MAVRVLIAGRDIETFDIDIEASESGQIFLARGPDEDAFKDYLHQQGGGWTACRFDLSCDLGTLRDCSVSGDLKAPGAVINCSNVEPPPASS